MIKGRDVRKYAAAVPEADQVRRQLRRVGDRVNFRSVLLLVAAAVVVLTAFHFENATIYGNTMYSQQQIEEFLTKGRLGDNTFIMALKYHNRKIENIPFVDRIDIDIVSPSTIRVNIKESPVDGVIEYGGEHVYFSENGLITAVSDRTVESSIKVTGVVLTHSGVGRKASAKNQLGLDLATQLMRIMDKYGIKNQATAIDVDAKCFLTVSFGDVQVKIGRTLYDEKMYRMKALLPHLQERSGVIDMSWTTDPQADIVLLPQQSEK